MMVTPTCHISEGEKDEEVVALVPVQPLNSLTSPDAARNLKAGGDPRHLFYLPPTDLVRIRFRQVRVLRCVDGSSGLPAHDHAVAVA
jgi:hypothetical protein